NLAALGKNHMNLGSLVQELLSRRVGRVRSVLDDRHDEISDPASLPDVIGLAARLQAARNRNDDIWMPRIGGSEIALKNMLAAIGFTNVRIAGDRPAPFGVERIEPGDVPSVGLPLGLFKAAQLIEMDESIAAFNTFTAI